MTPGGLRTFAAKHRMLLGGISITLACLAAATAVSTAGIAVSRLQAYLQHETRGPLSEMPPWVVVGLLWLTALQGWGNRLAGEGAAPPGRDAGRIIGLLIPLALIGPNLSLLGFVLTVFATEPIQVKGLTGLSYAFATLGGALVTLGFAILGRALMRRPKETAEV